MIARSELIAEKFDGKFLLPSERQENANSPEPLRNSIIRGLKARYGDIVGDEVAHKPFRLLVFSDDARNKYGLNAAVIIGDEAGSLVEEDTIISENIVDFKFKDPNDKERQIDLVLNGDPSIICPCWIGRIGISYQRNRNFCGWSSSFVKFLGEQAFKGDSTVVAIIPTPELFETLLARFRTDNIKLPLDFVLIDNQIPQS
jgi:hypothetical protein